MTITALTDDNALSSDECTALIGTTHGGRAASSSCTYTVTHTEAGQLRQHGFRDGQGQREQHGHGLRDDETVTVTDVLPTVDLTKTAPADTWPEPGGDFIFTLSITQHLGRSGDHRLR